jgi:hypothetical protein
LLTSSLVKLHPMAIGLLKPLGCHHFAISSVEEASAERRYYKYHLRVEPPLHALAAAIDPTVTIEFQVATAALPRGKSVASEVVATTMVASTSSVVMTILTGATALLRHIAAAGCRTNSVRCRRLRPPRWGRGATQTHAKATTSSSSCYSAAVPTTPSPSLVAHSWSALGYATSLHGPAPPTLLRRCSTPPLGHHHGPGPPLL